MPQSHWLANCKDIGGNPIRCGVFFGLFLFSIFYWSDVSSKLCCTSKSMMKHQQNPIWKLKLPWFTIVVGSAWLLNPEPKYIGSPKLFTINCGIVDKISRCTLVQSLWTFYCWGCIPMNLELSYHPPRWGQPTFIKIQYEQPLHVETKSVVKINKDFLFCFVNVWENPIAAKLEFW